MVTKQKDLRQLSIMEAVEALEAFADLDFEKDVRSSSEQEIIEHNNYVTAKSVKWIGEESPDKTVKFVKGTFRTVLDYLREFYDIHKGEREDPKVTEGVKTIMVLVGEAAKKLDQYTTLFEKTNEHAAQELKEYKTLQQFYLTRIARKIDDGILGKWILALAQGPAEQKRDKETVLKGKMPFSATHIFMDLEGVKKDSDYELFFVRKEDGSRFYNPRLIRNIKLVCDFGERLQEKFQKDPLEDIASWQDHAVHIGAKSILLSMGPTLDRFYKVTQKAARGEMVEELNKALFALFLASNPRNLARNIPVKNCSGYFRDFLVFFRRAFNSREYQRFLLYPPKKSAKLAQCLLETVHQLSCGLFTTIHGFSDLIPPFEKLLQQGIEAHSKEHEHAAEASQKYWSNIASHWHALKKIVKHHFQGPLGRVLEVLDSGGFHAFDSIGMLNLPSQMYSIYFNEHKTTNIRLPSPTSQEFVHRADVLNEFKGMLLRYQDGKLHRRHLLINLQDRTSWKEHSRSTALENLQNHHEFAPSLAVVTLTKDTEFYHQTGPYQKERHADVFIENFLEHLGEESCGFYFSEELKAKLIPSFIDSLIASVHKIFFNHRNVLTVDERCDFIEIVYLFLQLKLLDLLEPETFSFTCKDGVDTGTCASIALYTFLKVMNNVSCTEEELENIDLMLNMPALLVRERVPLEDQLERLVKVLKRIESVKEDIGVEMFSQSIQKELGKHFKTPILKKCKIVTNF